MLNAEYFSMLPIAVVFNIYIYTHTKTHTHRHNVLQWLTIYILNSGPVRNTQEVSAQGDEKTE